VQQRHGVVTWSAVKYGVYNKLSDVEWQFIMRNQKVSTAKRCYCFCVLPLHVSTTSDIWYERRCDIARLICLPFLMITVLIDLL
jgi:hypothetical protein